jgi:hypothetical protein
MILRKKRSLGVALTLAVLLVIAVAALAAQSQNFEAVLGGNSSILAQDGKLLVVQATGTGQGSIGGTNLLAVNGKVVLKAELDISQSPVPIRKGTFTVVAPNGDELTGVFEGRASMPDPASFISATGTFTVTRGTGVFSRASGSGTVRWLFHQLDKTFVTWVTGSLSLAQGKG